MSKAQPQSLQLECVLVRESLSQLSGWVRERLRSAEEDMDIFRVIYSLHGSLSQASILRVCGSVFSQYSQSVRLGSLRV